MELITTPNIVKSISTKERLRRLQEENAILKETIRKGVIAIYGAKVLVYKCSVCQKELTPEDQCSTCKKPLYRGLCFTCNPDARRIAHNERSKRYRARQKLNEASK